MLCLNVIVYSVKLHIYYYTVVHGEALVGVKHRARKIGNTAYTIRTERERGRKKCNLHVLSSLSVSTPFFFVCFVRSTVECSLPYNVFNYLARNRQPSTLIIMRWNTVCVCFIFASVAVAPNAFNTLENYIRSYLYLSIVWNGRTRVRWKTKLSIIIFFALCFEEHCLNESRNNTKKKRNCNITLAVVALTLEERKKSGIL